MTLHKLNPLFAAEFAAGEWAPAVDIIENDRAIMVKAELPGIDAKDIAVTLDNTVLTLTGERHVDPRRPARFTLTTTCTSEEYGAVRSWKSPLSTRS